MKRSLIALSVVAVMSLSACASQSGDWTPMNAGRTAGEQTYTAPVAKQKKADMVFSQSLQK